MVNFKKKNTNKPSLLHVYIYIKVHDIHCEPKSYRLKLLKKLIVKDGIKILFDGKSYLNLTMTYLFIQFIKTRCKSKNKDYEPKPYKFKLLGKLVTQ